MIQNIQPTNDNVLIKRIKKESKTTLKLREEDKLETCYAEVLSFGKDSLDQIELNVHDTVVLGKYVGHKITVDDLEYYFVKPKDILAVLKGE